jgi:hypothetical protein
MLLCVVRQLYGAVLRELLVKAVADTETDWDDRLVSICDAAILYHPDQTRTTIHA